MARRGVALISGFAPGLSEELALALIETGYHVAGFSRSGERAKALAQNTEGFSGYACDVGDGLAVNGLVERVRGDHGDISLVIHNAAQLVIRDFEATKPADFESLWRTSCLGAVHLSQAVLPGMVERGSGTLIFSGATASVRGGAKFAAFASAKFALRGLAQSLARSYAPKGIHIVHTVLDGVIWGERAEKAFEMQPEQCMSTSAIAQSYMALLQQSPAAWTHELDLRPASEKF